MASETAATRAVQSTVTRQLREHRFACHWGLPVPDRPCLSNGRPGLRGAALGTAIFSSLPSRGPLEALPESMASSCRISESFVRTAGFEFRVIALYGVPECLPDSSLRNNLLLSWAHQRATAVRVPTVIGGDFNTSPQGLPTWEAFQRLGWVELHEYASQVLHQPLPPTCRHATYHDTFLISPELLPFIAGADVPREPVFDSHKPVRLHLQGLQTSPQPHIWRLPRDWTVFGISTPHLAAAYQSTDFAQTPLIPPSCTEELDSQLQSWSRAIESSVSMVMQRAAQADPSASFSALDYLHLTEAAANPAEEYRAPALACLPPPVMDSHSLCARPLRSSAANVSGRPDGCSRFDVDSVNSSPCLSVLGAIFYIPIFALSGRLSWLRRDIEVRSPAGRCSGHALDFSPAPFLTWIWSRRCTSWCGMTTSPSPSRRRTLVDNPFVTGWSSGPHSRSFRDLTGQFSLSHIPSDILCGLLTAH